MICRPQTYIQWHYVFIYLFFKQTSAIFLQDAGYKIIGPSTFNILLHLPTLERVKALKE